MIQLGALGAELFDRIARFLFKIFFASVQVIKAPRYFTHHFYVWHLIFTHWHHTGAVDQHISGLQQRIAEETIRRQIAIGEFFLLIFVSRHAFEPAQRGRH